MFALELFGTLSLRDDAGVVPPAARQKRRVGLLAILALGGTRGLSRHRVEAYLWSESTAARARHALDQTVYAIRRALDGDVILSTGQELRLNPESILPDVWEFGKAIRANQWRAAARIHRGPLLDGFQFGESHELELWIDSERGRLLHECQTAIERLAERAAEAGDHLQDVTWRRRLVSANPLSAGTTRKLIKALAASGDRASAVRQAREYQEFVRQELAMEPDLAIERLATSLSRPSMGEIASAAVAPAPAIVRAPVDDARTHPLPDLSVEDWERENAAPHVPSLARGARTATSRSLSVAGALMITALAAMLIRGRDRPVHVVTAAPHALRRIPRPEARQAYLGGIGAWEDRTKEGLDRAVVLFRRATVLDPEYADGYAGLGEAYVRLGYFGFRPADAMFPKAKDAALRSIQLDSTLASAHTALATELVWEHSYAAAEAEYRIAISLEPSNALSHQWYGVLLMILGRVPEAVAQEKSAAELEPLSLQIQNNYATFVNVSGDHIGALRLFRKSMGEEPDSAWVRRNPWVLANMARVYADNGEFVTATAMMTRALAILPGNPRAVHTMAVIYDEMGRRDLARQAFAHADSSNEQYAAYRGMAYASEGSLDSAFLWFDREAKWGIQPMISLQSDWRMDGARRDRRYSALLTRLGLPQSRAAAP